MNIGLALQDGLLTQDIYCSVDEICFDLYLDDGTVLPCSFLNKETKDELILAVTSDNGSEQIKVVPKSKIVLVSVVYQQDLELMLQPNGDEEDCMYE